mmetsp:Transcript_2239/g.6601  ORF Transcript_2239/g.6601 Transcript_2239/m.6601 type:complete len:266 (-) Transcript_2239:1551-2348(-)
MFTSPILTHTKCLVLITSTASLSPLEARASREASICSSFLHYPAPVCSGPPEAGSLHPRGPPAVSPWRSSKPPCLRPYLSLGRWRLRRPASRPWCLGTSACLPWHHSQCNPPKYCGTGTPSIRCKAGALHQPYCSSACHRRTSHTKQRRICLRRPVPRTREDCASGSAQTPAQAESSSWLSGKGPLGCLQDPRFPRAAAMRCSPAAWPSVPLRSSHTMCRPLQSLQLRALLRRLLQADPAHPLPCMRSWRSGKTKNSILACWSVV